MIVISCYLFMPFWAQHRYSWLDGVAMFDRFSIIVIVLGMFNSVAGAQNISGYVG